MSDCQFPNQCGFPNCFCVGMMDKQAKRNQRNAIVISTAMMILGFIVGMAI